MEIKRIIVGILQTNCYLLVGKGELAVVDPGDNAEIIIREAGKTGAVPKSIINTHCHFDHIGANIPLKEKYNLPVMSGIGKNCGADFSPDVVLSDGQEIIIGGSKIKVMATPGHTPGGICLFEDGFMLSGDTLFDGSIGRTDLPGGSNRDMAVSLEKLDAAIAAGTVVYPGHGPVFKYRKGMALEYLEFLK